MACVRPSGSKLGNYFSGKDEMAAYGGEYGKPIVAIFNNFIYIQFNIYIYEIFFSFVQFNI